MSKTQHKVNIIPLGGLGEIGKNMTAFRYGDDIILVDAGLMFPEEDMLGIDLVIPDITYLLENKDKVRAIFLTHGHEDHIGALPYVMKQINVPVYGTALTLGILQGRLKENGVSADNCHVIKPGDKISAGAFKLGFMRVNHSIPDAIALAIRTPVGLIIHTGDFKFDQTPVDGQVTEFNRFAEYGDEGVLLLMADSTNAERPGYTPSEKMVGQTFDDEFRYAKNRIIVATFASNVDRVQQIIDCAYSCGKKVVIEGRSMVSTISTAAELGYIKIPDNTLIDIEQMKNYVDEQLVLITTGSQGETMAALSRMAASTHRKVSIKPGDVIIFSSHPIPGNEKAVSKVMNELAKKGASVIFQDTHVSGHACQEEIKLIYTLTKPQYAIPIHGEYRHLKRHKDLAIEMGIPKENVMILQSGDVLTISKEQAKVTGHVPAQGILVDGLGVGDVGNIVLRDRQHLSQNGLFIVVVTLDRYNGVLLAGPDIVSRGFVYVRESEKLMEEAKSVVTNTLEHCNAKKITDWGRIKGAIRDDLGDYIWKKMKRSPMILPIIMEV